MIKNNEIFLIIFKSTEKRLVNRNCRYRYLSLNVNIDDCGFDWNPREIRHNHVTTK